MRKVLSNKFGRIPSAPHDALLTLVLINEFTDLETLYQPC